MYCDRSHESLATPESARCCNLVAIRGLHADRSVMQKSQFGLCTPLLTPELIEYEELAGRGRPVEPHLLRFFAGHVIDSGFGP